MSYLRIYLRILFFQTVSSALILPQHHAPVLQNLRIRLENLQAVLQNPCIRIKKTTAPSHCRKKYSQIFVYKLPLETTMSIISAQSVRSLIIALTKFLMNIPLFRMYHVFDVCCLVAGLPRCRLLLTVLLYYLICVLQPPFRY